MSKDANISIPMNRTPNWRERLRDLYLFESPDEDGLKTDSIEFNHGRLKFEQRENTVAKFYFVSQEPLELFIEKTIETEKCKAVAESLKKVVIDLYELPPTTTACDHNHIDMRKLLRIIEQHKED